MNPVKVKRVTMATGRLNISSAMEKNLTSSLWLWYLYYVTDELAFLLFGSDAYVVIWPKPNIA